MTDGRAAIDRLRDPDGHLGREAIRRILPYGEDFLFVDSVERLTADEVEAGFLIPQRSPYLDSHFVDLALMPGVLIGEGLAQAASLIVRYNLSSLDEHHVLGLEVERVRFLAPALPGDRLAYTARLETINRRTARLVGKVAVLDRRICSARLVVAIVVRDRLRRELSNR